MDIQRKSVARKRRIRRSLYGLLAAGAIVLVTVGLSRLEPAAPSLERGTVWMGDVERGSMVRQVRGSGTLVPEEIRWIPAENAGRVERIFVQPGAVVTATATILELSNPEREQEALDTEHQLKRSEAEQANLEIQLESQYLALQAEVATIESEYLEAKLQAEAEEELAKDGLISRIIMEVSRSRADSLSTREELGKQRLAIFSKAMEAQMEAKRAEVEQQRVLHQLRLLQLDSLKVRSGNAGVVQEVMVEVGQQVTLGTNLARVADPDRLKAEIRIAATEARDIQFGQNVSVDTGNGIIAGIVSRIDPAVQEGLVTVDVRLTEELPLGARPDLNVEGIIELEVLEDILYMPRPVFVQENTTVGLFKLESDGTHGVRVQVELGRSSVVQVEVRGGLEAGDQVFLSDMSQWDAFDRIQLK
jgi:HlyD family secretion protein